MLMLQAVIVWVATAILVGYAAALILLAKISMTVVLTLGPLFIGLLLFDATKQFFTGWLNQALNGLFQYVIAVLIVSIGIGFFATAADSTVTKIGSAIPSFLFVLQLIIVGVAVFVALMQAGAIASALAGGVQLATMGAVGALTNKAAAFAAAPFTAMKALRSFNQNRIASDYHRQQMGLKPTMTTRMINRAVRGHNEIQKK